jgi:hypothetical protein
LRVVTFLKKEGAVGEIVAKTPASLKRPTVGNCRFKAAPAAQPILDAIETLKRMDADGLRRLPADSPIDFVRTCATEEERGLKRQEEVDRAELSSIFSQ